MSQNLSSAAVVIDALKVKGVVQLHSNMNRYAIFLTLKAPRKKKHLKMSSAEIACCKQLPNITEILSIEVNSVDPEQTAPIGAV